MKTAIYRRRGAFTLIELLIVIAIIAITVAGSMAVVTGPMFAKVRAEDQQAFETGAGVFFATLVQDAHRSVALNADTSGTLAFTLAAPTTGTIVYAINDRGVVMRKVEGNPQETKLVPRALSLTAEKLSTGSLYSVRLTGTIRGYDTGVTIVSRSMDVLVGSSDWAGGA